MQILLAVTQVEQHWYADIYRSVMWFIGKGILSFLDGFFSIINKIWRFQFFNSEYVNKIFGGAVIVASSWLILKVVIELIMNYIVKNEGKGNPLTIYRGIVLAIVMMFLISPLFDFGHNISTALTDDVIEISNLSKESDFESSMSKALLRAMVVEEETEEDDIAYFIDNWKNIEINETTGGFIGIGNRYTYSLNFFMLIVIAIIVIFLLFFVAIQMAKRVMEIALYKIIGVFCCSSLTNNGKSFDTWLKSAIGLFLVTIVQFVSIGLLLSMFETSFSDNGYLTGIFLVIGALLFIIGTPTLINSLLGQQSGMMSAFGDMQSLMAISTPLVHGLGLAKAGAMATLSTGAHIVGKGGEALVGGVGKISDMLNKGKKLTPDQKEQVKETLSQHNTYKAQRQVTEFLNQNSKGKYNNVLEMQKYKPIMNPHRIGFRNQYMNQSSLKINNNIGGNKK